MSAEQDAMAAEKAEAPEDAGFEVHLPASLLEASFADRQTAMERLNDFAKAHNFRVDIRTTVREHTYLCCRPPKSDFKPTKTPQAPQALVSCRGDRCASRKQYLSTSSRIELAASSVELSVAILAGHLCRSVRAGSGSVHSVSEPHRTCGCGAALWLNQHRAVSRNSSERRTPTGVEPRVECDDTHATGKVASLALVRLEVVNPANNVVELSSPGYERAGASFASATCDVQGQLVPLAISPKSRCVGTSTTKGLEASASFLHASPGRSGRSNVRALARS